MIDAVAIVLETFRISLPTVIEAMFGGVTRDKVDSRLLAWSQRVLDRIHAKLDVRGREAIDWSRPYVVMSNHQSHFDIPIACNTVPGSLRFIAKKELYRIPVFGKALVESGMIRIDRDDRKSAIESLKVAADTIRQGYHVWIAPEGTRSRTGEVGPLKKGGFILAMETGTPIVPLAIDGAFDILPPKTYRIRRGVPVKVTFGAPLETARRERSAIMEEIARFYSENVTTAR